jgi:uncharacterized protein
MLTTGRILEGLVTTCDIGGQAHLAPMGPIVDEAMQTLRLRPFQSSTTFRNLQRTGEGVLHVTDDVELLAKAAVGKVETLPALHPTQNVTGWILDDACRWYEFRVDSIDTSQERSEIVATVVAQGQQRDFFGFNRAMHAVVELAILATRVHLLSPDFLQSEIERLAIPVQKTAGPKEIRAFEFLSTHLRNRLAEQPESASDSSPTSGAAS